MRRLLELLTLDCLGWCVDSTFDLPGPGLRAGLKGGVGMGPVLGSRRRFDGEEGGAEGRGRGKGEEGEGRGACKTQDTPIVQRVVESSSSAVDEEVVT